MQDGRLVWTVSDGGFLKMAESNGASPPPWWSQCSPAFNVTPPTAAVYKNKTALNYYRCSEDVVFETVVSGQNKKWGKPAGKLLPVNTQMTMETDNAAQTVTRPDNRVFKLMTMTADVAGTPLKRGERVWVVADGGNLEAVAAQTGSSPKFDEVVIPATQVAIQAGAALGHLGFFQIPTETSFRSRYMVHIECLTSDSKVASFLTNPQAAGRESPAFLKYPADAKLFSKDAQGAMAESSRKTKAPGILTLSNVPAVSADGIPTHYQIRPEGGFLAADSVEKLSQFDLGKLGFSIIKDDPESFQLLDAENQPQNVVKGIFEKLKAAAEDDPAFSNALASHKYKQLLDVIDQNHDGYYSVDEYRNAVHNPAYRDPLYQLIVQHPSEWYYEKTDAKWTKYLEKLEPDASKWKKYTEAFLDKMIWMKKVAGMGPAPWHMHPVMFMGALIPKRMCACNRDITFSELKLITSGASDEVINSYIDVLNQGFNRFGITTCRSKSHFISQILHESGNLHYTSEIGGSRKSYSPWYGRGLIQVTLEANYIAYGSYIGEDVTSSDSNREKLTNLPHSVLSAFWFFNIYKSLGNPASNDDFNKITAVINGGFNGYNERLGYFITCVTTLGTDHLNHLMLDNKFNFEDSAIYNSKIYSFGWGLWHDSENSRSGTDKNTEESLKGYKRARDLLLTTPFPASMNNKKIYGIEYGNLSTYINARILAMESRQ